MKDNYYSVFIGDVALDEYYAVEKWPGLTDKADCKMLPGQMGGTIANAACVYASYGMPTYFLGRLNPNDKFLCDDLETWGINTSLTRYDDALAPSKCMIFLSENEHTVFLLDTQIKSIPLTWDMQHVLCDAGLIYTNLFTLKLLTLESLAPEAILNEWRQHHVKVVVDCDVNAISADEMRFVPGLHTIIFNENGYRLQCAGRTEEQTAQALLELGPEIIIETLAEKGCNIYTRKQTVHIDGVRADVADVTGAGDTFCSSFAFFFGLCEDAVLSGKWATYASSLAVTKMGARGGANGVRNVLQYIQKTGGDTSLFSPYIQ